MDERIIEVWIIEVKGPDGVKAVAVPDEKVQARVANTSSEIQTTDPYLQALWLGFVSLYDEVSA